MRRSNGFTIIELLVAITLLVAIGGLTLIQKNDLDASRRDQVRKIAVNSFHAGLKLGFYKQNKYYPTSINEKNLPYIDKSLFTDPWGKKVGTPTSDYHYRGLNCEAEKCQKFEVSAKLEKEASYAKSSDS
jgi:Tfp pilus assembly protein PilE